MIDYRVGGLEQLFHDQAGCQRGYRVQAQTYGGCLYGFDWIDAAV